jgi:hypothetical protein
VINTLDFFRKKNWLGDVVLDYVQVLRLRQVLKVFA